MKERSHVLVFLCVCFCYCYYGVINLFCFSSRFVVVKECFHARSLCLLHREAWPLDRCCLIIYHLKLRHNEFPQPNLEYFLKFDAQFLSIWSSNGPSKITSPNFGSKTHRLERFTRKSYLKFDRNFFQQARGKKSRSINGSGERSIRETRSIWNNASRVVSIQHRAFNTERKDRVNSTSYSTSC